MPTENGRVHIVVEGADPLFHQRCLTTFRRGKRWPLEGGVDIPADGRRFEQTEVLVQHDGNTAKGVKGQMGFRLERFRAAQMISIQFAGNALLRTRNSGCAYIGAEFGSNQLHFRHQKILTLEFEFVDKAEISAMMGNIELVSPPWRSWLRSSLPALHP